MLRFRFLCLDYSMHLDPSLYSGVHFRQIAKILHQNPHAQTLRLSNKFSTIFPCNRARLGSLTVYPIFCLGHSVILPSIDFGFYHYSFRLYMCSNIVGECSSIVAWGVQSSGLLRISCYLHSLVICEHIQLHSILQL